MGIDKSQLKNGRITGDVGNRQGYSEEDKLKREYMVGIYGYQEGYASFGIMENGTAFFGRADRGGRIIIDGYNATIYGGANGEMEDPAIGDPMWNTMRLTFVDLTHATGNLGFDDPSNYYNELNPQDIAATEVDGIKQGFNGHFYGEADIATGGYLTYTDPSAIDIAAMNDPHDLPWWYRYVWEHAYIVEEGYPRFASDIGWGTNVDFTITKPNKTLYPWDRRTGTKWTPINYWLRKDMNLGPGIYPDDHTTYDPRQFYVYDGTVYLKDPVHGQLTGYGANRASTTPAIEIGQHVKGLFPSPIQYDLAFKALGDLESPGQRNFLVTYDGTLWAMNAIIKGNIISSNIIGGSIYGAEIGIGNDNTTALYEDYRIEALDDFIQLKAPKEKKYINNTGETAPTAFYVNTNGEVWARAMNIYGGQIHIGHFHILGAEDASDLGGYPGDLIQYGESDFVGPVHIYGSMGIGPIYSPSQPSPEFSASNTQWGNLYQSAGQVGLGILAPKNNLAAFHGLLKEGAGSGSR